MERHPAVPDVERLPRRRDVVAGAVEQHVAQPPAEDDAERHPGDEIIHLLGRGDRGAALNQRARDTGVAEVLSKPLVARDIARSLAGALRNGA